MYVTTATQLASGARGNWSQVYLTSTFMHLINSRHFLSSALQQGHLPTEWKPLQKAWGSF